jgi:hypothetical protein
MKALCLVAHPDDCIIFAYPFIKHYSTFDWTICYLTYSANDNYRGREISKFWQTRNIKTIFLEHVDNYHDLENGKISFDTKLAKSQIKDLVLNYDIVLSHGEKGEYGHLHHKFVHNCVKDYPNLICFADHNTGTYEYTLQSTEYNITEIPIHASAVSEFFINNPEHKSSYITDKITQELLKDY